MIATTPIPDDVPQPNPCRCPFGREARMRRLRRIHLQTPALLCFWVLLILYLVGCQSTIRSQPTGEQYGPAGRINRIVVVGFQPALSPGDPPGIIRGPLSGAVFEAEPVPRDRVELPYSGFVAQVLSIQTGVNIWLLLLDSNQHKLSQSQLSYH